MRYITFTYTVQCSKVTVKGRVVMNVKLWDKEAEVYVTYYVSLWAERSEAYITVWDEGQNTEYYDADTDTVEQCIFDGCYSFNEESVAEYVHNLRKVG